MEKPEQSYQKTAAAVGRRHAEVWPGRMMSAPGIQYREKVFAFFRKGAMVFRLGKGYAIESVGVQEYSLLNPFKDRPPMAAWFVVPHSEAQHWTRLAEIALERLMEELASEAEEAPDQANQGADKSSPKSRAAGEGGAAAKAPAKASGKSASKNAGRETATTTGSAAKSPARKKAAARKPASKKSRA